MAKLLGAAALIITGIVLLAGVVMGDSPRGAAEQDRMVAPGAVSGDHGRSCCDNGRSPDVAGMDAECCEGGGSEKAAAGEDCRSDDPDSKAAKDEGAGDSKKAVDHAMDCCADDPA